MMFLARMPVLSLLLLLNCAFGPRGDYIVEPPHTHSRAWATREEAEEGAAALLETSRLEEVAAETSVTEELEGRPTQFLASLPAEVEHWSPRVQGRGSWAGEFVQTLRVGSYADGPAVYQDVASKKPRACALMESGEWLVHEHSEWQHAALPFRREARLRGVQDWPVLTISAPKAAAERESRQLGTFAPLAGHWNGRPVLGNWTSEGVVDRLLYWCDGWVLGGPASISGNTKACPPSVEEVFGALSASWQALNLVGSWEAWSFGEKLGELVLEPHDELSHRHGLITNPLGLRGAFFAGSVGADKRGAQDAASARGHGLVIPTSLGVRLAWTFEKPSPYWGQYEAVLDAGGVLFNFAGNVAWVRQAAIPHLASSAEQTRAEAYQCTLRLLAAGQLPQEVCLPQFCACSVQHETRVGGRIQAVWPVPRQVFDDGVSASWVALAIFVAAIWLMGTRGAFWWAGCDDVQEHTTETTGELGDAQILLRDHKLRPLQLLRLVGAMHVVAFHCYPSNPYAQWGGPFWMSWFFMMSGFGLTRQRMRASADNENVAARKAGCGTHLLRRLRSIYPLHLLGLTLGVVVTDFADVRSWKFVENLLLLQAWHADGLPVGEPWNHVNWFLSTLFLFYLIFDLVYLVVSRIPQHRRHWALLLCWAWSFIGHGWGYFYGLNPWDNVDATAVLSKQFRYTHALCNYQCFVFGVVLAHIAAGPVWPSCRPGSATFGLVAIWMLITAGSPWTAYVALWNGLLLPLHGFIVLGIAWHTAADPLARLMDQPWAEGLGELAFPIYILHIVILKCYQRYVVLEFPPRGPLYPSLVFIAAVVATYGIQHPFRALDHWLTKPSPSDSRLKLT